MNNPDADDSYSVYIEDMLVLWSDKAEAERVEWAESIIPPPEDDDTLPELAEAELWAWMWQHRRADYHDEMSRRIYTASDDHAEALDAAWRKHMGMDQPTHVPGEYDEI